MTWSTDPVILKAKRCTHRGTALSAGPDMSHTDIGVARHPGREREKHMQHAVVIGNGSLGRQVLADLQHRGVDATVGSRTRPAGGDDRWVHLDASEETSVRSATRGADAVLLCAAPPLTRWSEDFEPLVRGTLAGLADSGATVVFASNMSPYGPCHGEPLTEDTTEDPAGPKARLRAHLDQLVLSAHDRSGLRTAVVRASSFYGPGVDVSVAGSRQLAALAAGEKVDALGSVDQPHSLCFIDDVARAIVDVALEESAHGQVWHAPVQDPLTLREFMTELGQEIGVEPRFRVASPLIVAVMSAFNADMRAVRESLYSYTSPFLVSDVKYRTQFGTGATPRRETLVATLAAEGFRTHGAV